MSDPFAIAADQVEGAKALLSSWLAADAKELAEIFGETVPSFPAGTLDVAAWATPNPESRAHLAAAMTFAGQPTAKFYDDHLEPTRRSFFPGMMSLAAIGLANLRVSVVPKLLPQDATLSWRDFFEPKHDAAEEPNQPAFGTDVAQLTDDDRSTGEPPKDQPEGDVVTPPPATFAAIDGAGAPEPE